MCAHRLARPSSCYLPFEERFFRFLKAYRNPVCRESKVHRLIVAGNPGVELQSSRAITPLSSSPPPPHPSIIPTYRIPSNLTRKGMTTDSKPAFFKAPVSDGRVTVLNSQNLLESINFLIPIILLVFPYQLSPCVTISDAKEIFSLNKI